MTDLISRADAIEELMKLPTDTTHSHFDDGYSLGIKHAIRRINTLPSADAVEVKADQLPPKVPTEWINDGMVLVPQHDWVEMQKELEGYASADAKRVLQGYCKGADCRWWNPQLNGCKRCVMIQDEYTHTSAELPLAELKQEFESADAVSGYAEWLEKIIVDAETLEWLCEDTPCKEWCDENCHYKSIQAKCLRHMYEVSKGGAE